MSNRSVRNGFDKELVDFVEQLYATADEAVENALANVLPPAHCAGIHLHQVQWHNGEPVAVRLYVETNTLEGIPVDGH